MGEGGEISGRRRRREKDERRKAENYFETIFSLLPVSWHSIEGSI